MQTGLQPVDSLSLHRALAANPIPSIEEFQRIFDADVKFVIQDELGNTPLHYLFKEPFSNSIEHEKLAIHILGCSLLNGTDLLELKNKAGKTAIDLALTVPRNSVIHDCTKRIFEEFLEILPTHSNAKQVKGALQKLDLFYGFDYFGPEDAFRFYVPGKREETLSPQSITAAV